MEKQFVTYNANVDKLYAYTEEGESRGCVHLQKFVPGIWHCKVYIVARRAIATHSRREPRTMYHDVFYGG